MTNETAQRASALKGQIRKFALAVVVLVAVFGLPLLKLVDFALHDEFFSYILLIPFTSFYLAWLLERKAAGLRFRCRRKNGPRYFLLLLVWLPWSGIF